MASASVGPHEIFHASPGKTNFIRLTRLLTCGGTKILKELFDFIFPPEDLANVLKKNKKRLETLKRQRTLSLKQFRVLFPSSVTYGKSESFDITLFFKLIKELSNLSPPGKGWDELPVGTDFSLSADIARIKFYRNKFAHDQTMELTDDEFKHHWKQIKDALIRIVNKSSCRSDPDSWETAIDNLLYDPITEEDEKTAEELLESWYQHDFEVKQLVLRNTTQINKLLDKVTGIEKNIPSSSGIQRKSISREFEETEGRLAKKEYKEDVPKSSEDAKQSPYKGSADVLGASDESNLINHKEITADKQEECFSLDPQGFAKASNTQPTAIDEKNALVTLKKNIGIRVVRGPDWKWDDQDGGEGVVGTVVQVKQNEDSIVEIVWVQWDTGVRANYRAGFDGKTDLRVYESSGTDMSESMHTGVMCDGCNQVPVVGMRWKCMKCDDYDLCTTCYNADTHELDHDFKRINTCRGSGFPVGKREGATKIQAKGIFSGARVVRGPDWRWGQQDGGQGGQGTVVGIIDWKIGKLASVKWDRNNSENVYMLGIGGKVDVKSIKTATGGFYYRDHLPVFKVRKKKTVSGFTTEDSVRVNVTKEQLMEMAEGHGGWHQDMEKCIPMIGVVHDFTQSGDVIVDYDGVKWRLAPQAITKIKKFKTGDKVLVSSDEELVMKLQEELGGWNPEMKTMLGKIGTVKGYDTAIVDLEVDGELWLVNSAILTLHEAAKENKKGDDDDDDDDDMENPLKSLLKTQVKKVLTEILTDGNQGSTSGKQKDDEGMALVKAANIGRVSTVTRILNARPELVDYYSTEFNMTCLHTSCHSGYCDIIKLLLEKNADTSIKDGQGYTAIHHAAYGDKSGEALKLLLDHGVDPNIANNDAQSTPLHLAVKESNYSGVKILMENEKCDVNLPDKAGDTPLHDAIEQKGKNAIVDLMLDASKPISLTQCNRQGFNSLHLAVFHHNQHAARKILDKSPELVNVAKEDGYTSLHVAAVNDRCEIAEIILEQPDCMVDYLTNNNQTPLMLAVHEGYLKMVQIFIQHGADVNAKDADGDTPLHISLMREKFFSAGMGKILDLVGNDGSSYLEISRYLISHGANVRQTNQDGKTPMDYGQGTKAEKDLRKAREESKSRESDSDHEDAQITKKTQVFCSLCVDVYADIVFKPCGHTVLCKECSVRAKRCPECKALVTDKTTQDDISSHPKDNQEETDTKL